MVLSSGLCLCSHTGTHKYEQAVAHTQAHRHSNTATITCDTMTPLFAHMHKQAHTRCVYVPQASSSLWDKYRNRIFTVFLGLVYQFTIVSVDNAGIVLKFSLTIFVFPLQKFTFTSIPLNLCTVGGLSGKIEIQLDVTYNKSWEPFGFLLIFCLIVEFCSKYSYLQ